MIRIQFFPRNQKMFTITGKSACQREKGPDKFKILNTIEFFTISAIQNKRLFKIDLFFQLIGVFYFYFVF